MMDVVGSETYSFIHQSFQEYLTASELAHRLINQDAARREEAWDFAWSKRTYSRWTEVLRLMVGILVQDPGGGNLAQRWLQSLVKQRETEDGDPGNLGLMLALHCLVEAAALPEWHSPRATELGEHIVSTSIKAVLADAPRGHWASPSEQLEAVARELSFLPGSLSDMAVKQCLTFLQGPDEGARKVAVEILKKQGERVPVNPLLATLESERANIREAVLIVLAEQGERVPLEPLLQALYDDDESVCEAAAQILEKQGQRVPLEPLLKLLSNKHASHPPNLVAHVFKVYGERLPLELFLDYLLSDDLAVTYIAKDVLID